MLMKTVVAAFGALLLAACGCTSIGCLSSVEISLASLVEWSGTESLTVELCLDTHCGSRVIDPGRAEQLRSNNRGNVSFDDIPIEAKPGTVSVSVSTADGFLQAESSEIRFDSDRPNGAFCEPVCHFASVMIEDGQLVDR